MPCENDCTHNPMVEWSEKDVCFANCSSINANELAKAWEIEEKVTERHLHDVNNQLAKSSYEENKDVIGTETWIKDLLNQRYALMVSE